MDVQAKLAQIRRAVEEARSMPMSASAVVNRGEILGLLDEVGEALRAELTEAQRVIDERESVVEEGREEARKIVAGAHKEQAGILSDTEVFRVARRAADDLVEKAKEQAESLRRETDQYVDTRLANLEISLERTIETVRRGRERLAGRSAFDALAVDDVDEIKLPEHLEG